MAAGAIALLAFGLAAVVGTAQEITIRAIRARTGEIRRWGGGILLGVGAWIIATAIFAEAFARLFPV